jgi:hypothetical protein
MTEGDVKEATREELQLSVKAAIIFYNRLKEVVLPFDLARAIIDTEDMSARPEPDLSE